MTAKPTDSSTPFPKLGKEQTEAVLGMQKELLEACEQASRAWLARVKSEVDLWSELATKLARTQSLPGSPGGLSGMRRTADANGRGRLAATLRRLSKGHANDHAVTVQWTAARKHLKSKPLPEWTQQADRKISVNQRSSREWRN